MIEVSTEVASIFISIALAVAFAGWVFYLQEYVTSKMWKHKYDEVVRDLKECRDELARIHSDV